MKKVFSLLWGLVVIALGVSSFTLAFTQEQQEAYKWAYKYGLTTQPTIEAARMNSPLTRQAFAKMVVNYLENVVWVRQSTSKTCYFPDESKITNELIPYTKKTCAYQIMWSDWKKFSPTQPIDRAQLWTVFSRILWWDRHNSTGKWYYIYHVNALQDAGIMNNIKNVLWTTAKRWDVMIMFKRMYEKFGSNVYLNSWNDNTYINSEQPIVIERIGDYESSDNEYISSVYSNSNVIYTWMNWTKYYYDDKFLNMLKYAAEAKWESDLADYLAIEAEYFKNGLDQMSDLDDEELYKSMWIDTDNIDTDTMTKQEKQELIEKFKSAFDKIIGENKDRNDKLVKDLGKITKNIGKDKFWLKEKYKKTKAFMEASNEFLDAYSESMLNLMEIALMKDEDDENAEEWLAQAFWLIWIALVYQWSAEEYQQYVEDWAIDAIKLLWGELDTSSINYVSWKYDNQNLNQRLSAAEIRARDVTRKSDLSQIQTAIVVSQWDKWIWPWMDKWATKWISISIIEKELMYAWMRYIPTDPVSSNINYWLWENYKTNTVKWDYLYLVTKRNWVNNWWFVVMSKQESAWNSNWIVCEGKSWLDNWYISNDTDLTDIKTCENLTKWNSCSAKACTYTNDSQLRYILMY